MLWTDAHVKQAKTILGKYPVSQFRSALLEVERVIKRPVTLDSLHKAFTRRGLETPTHYCSKDAHNPETARPELLDKLFKVVKKGPIAFSELCDKLDLSPARTKELIQEAQAASIPLQVQHDHVGVKMPEPATEVQTVGIAPIVGKTQRVGVISDTHLGSKYCLRDQLKDFVHAAYEKGVREILHPGDVLDGMYRHGMWEVSHSGLEEQGRDLLETLPQLPGLNYRCITGNHDFTFTEGSGVDVGRYLTTYFRENGREDLHFYGNRGAFLKVGGAVVHLWHPKSGSGYARSYAIQKQIEKYTPGAKPSILLTGHWHIYCHIMERGVHGIACPTFQGGQSAFSKSLGGSPAIGGLVLSWELTKHGTLREFQLNYRSYYERERLVEFGDAETSAIPIE